MGWRQLLSIIYQATFRSVRIIFRRRVVWADCWSDDCYRRCLRKSKTKHRWLNGRIVCIRFYALGYSRTVILARRAMSAKYWTNWGSEWTNIRTTLTTSMPYAICADGDTALVKHYKELEHRSDLVNAKIIGTEHQLYRRLTMESLHKHIQSETGLLDKFSNFIFYMSFACQFYFSLNIRIRYLWHLNSRCTLFHLFR